MNQLVEVAKNRLLVAGIAGMLACAFALPALAQGSSAQQEVNTAHQHAMFAQKADSVDMAHTHLHHVINCLVGPNGQAFDSNVANPCKGQGNGAIPDSKGNSDLHDKLQSALADAKAGLKANSLKAVHQDASKAGAALKSTPAQKSSGGYSW